MTDVNAEAAKAAAEATSATEAKKPQPLTDGEWALAICLFTAGLIVIGITLFAFSSTDADFTFKAKEKTVTEPVAISISKGQREKRRQQGTAAAAKAKASALKTTREVDYSDTVAIFALTLGAALTLGGAFYARLRSLKLGGLELGFVAADDMKAAAEQAKTKVEEKIAEKNITDPGKKEAAVAAVQPVAVADLTKAAALGVQPTEQVIEGIADQAAAKVAEAFE